jgi:hypothetical protein
MTRLIILLAAGAAGLAAAVPATAQVPYQSPYAYPQQNYPPGYYPQQGYGYPQQGQGSVSQIINQLLGNRYNTNDHHAVERCATAAVNQANAQYRRSPYGQGYGNQGYSNQGYYPAQMRVAAITEVRRRNNGVRVSGLLDSRHGYGQPPYGNAYGYQGQGYGAQGDLTFRCDVNYRGAVSNVRVRLNQRAYNRGF